MPANGGWYLTWAGPWEYEHHTRFPRTLPQVMRLVYIMRLPTKPLAYYSTTGPRG